MALKGKLKHGMRIFGSDGREYSTINRYDDQYAYVGQRRIPVSAFERMDSNSLYVGKAGAQYLADDARAMTDGEIRVPVVEERLEVERRQEELGSVDIRKDVASEQVNIPVELRHEEVTVSSVDVPDRPVGARDLDDAFKKEGTIRVPVRGEEAIVDKRTVVTGEVVVDKEQRTERQALTDTVRREEVTIDHTKDAPVRHRQGHVPHRDER